MMKSMMLATAAVLITATAQAEIVCTERGGCWETGGRVRLPPSPYRGAFNAMPSRTGGVQPTKGVRYLDTPAPTAGSRR
jgi:hypothetical protein